MKPVTEDLTPLLENLLDQLALALERARLEREAGDFASTRQRDRLRLSLLASIGDDLRPMADSLAASVRQLRRDGGEQKPAVSEIDSAVLKFRRYIDNLVDVGVEGEQLPIIAGPITIDLFRRTVVRDGQPVHLTPKEYAVLAELAKHRGRVLSHAHLLRAVWGPAQEQQVDYLRVAIRALRQKLESDPASPRLIVNEPGVGYRLVASDGS
jgi:two-component system sensor histidine kinase KdpD